MATELQLPAEKTKWHYTFVAKWLLPSILRLLGGLHVSGQDNVPMEGGTLLCPNHLSYLDPPLTGSASPRRCCYMAKEPLFRIPLLGHFIRKSYAYLVDRDSGGRGAIRTAIKLLNAGELVVIYPEGTRSPDGEPLPCRPGAALIATRTQVPVVPAAIWGTDVVLPRHARRLYRCPIYVQFGEPIQPPQVDDGQKVGKSRIRQFSGKIEQQMHNLYDTVKEAVPEYWLQRAQKLREHWQRIHAPEAEQLRQQLEAEK